MSDCPNCHKEVKDGARFCAECGAKIEMASAPAENVAKKCPKCNSDVPGDAHFCLSCGAPLDHVPTASVKGPVVKISDLPVAPAGQRILAACIDVLVVLALIWPLYRIGGAARMFARKTFFFNILPALFLVFRDSFGGKSPGKLFLGLVAVNIKESKAADIADSILRNWFMFVVILPPAIGMFSLGRGIFSIFALIILIQILTGKNQRIGEKMANTKVVEAQKFRSLQSK